MHLCSLPCASSCNRSCSNWSLSWQTCLTLTSCQAAAVEAPTEPGRRCLGKAIWPLRLVRAMKNFVVVRSGCCCTSQLGGLAGMYWQASRRDAWAFAPKPTGVSVTVSVRHVSRVFLGPQLQPHSPVYEELVLPRTPGSGGVAAHQSPNGRGGCGNSI